MTSIGNIPEGLLRAWADHGVISSATYVHEMERRGLLIPRVPIKETPPLDYALVDDLTIPDCELDLSDFDDPIGPMPPPPAVKWIAMIAAVLIILSLWMVL